MFTQRRAHRTLGGIALTALVAASAPTLTASADQPSAYPSSAYPSPSHPSPPYPSTEVNSVQQWNDTAGQVAVASCISPNGNPLHESRMYAMTFLAVHDALNTVDRRYQPYAPGKKKTTTKGASADAAVAGAARTVLVSAVEELPVPPECRAAALEVAQDAYTTALEAVPDGPAEDAGVATGVAAAERIIARRAGDGSDTPLVVKDFEQGTEPGQWRFTPDRPFAFAPGWADVKPFALKGKAGFRAAPPYPLRSKAYARDFAEVKALGGDGVGTPSARTADQTEAARFWIESSPLQWNRIARSVAVQRELDPWESARLFALLNTALADGYIASWAVKYDDLFWRPVTAIPEAGNDGNRATKPDPTWTPLDTTPPIPDHDSAHAVQGAAAATVMTRFFGTDRVSFSTCSLTLPEGQQCDDPNPTERTYRRFSQAAQENADSRVWVGYHFRHASEVGLGHGRRVAILATSGLLKKARGGSHHGCPKAS